MSPRFSAYLDGVRFAAALTVLLSHFAYERISGGGLLFIRALNLGSDAVMLFFVLSGLVIAHAAAKEGSLRSYAFARLTRIYSVAIPAVVLTLAADRIGVALAPQLYDGWWYAPGPIFDQAIRALTFTNELGFESYRIGSNGPYWSLTYEVWYYALFGAAFFMKGAGRWAALVILACLAGAKVLLLIPAWVMGVHCYRHVVKGTFLTPDIARVLAAAPPVLYILFLVFDLPGNLRTFTVSMLGEGFVDTGLRFSDEFLWNGIIGLLATAHFAGMSDLLRAGHASSLAPTMRWCAGMAFSLYLIHYPLLQFFAAWLPHTPGGVGVLIATILTAILFAQVFERTLGTQRLIIKRLFGQAQVPSPAA